MNMIRTAIAICILSTGAACEKPDSVSDDTVAAADAGGLPQGEEAMIASALSAAPKDITDKATVLDGSGKVLRQGTNGWTCLPESAAMGPMCNDETWMTAMGGMPEGKPFPTGRFAVSYMLAGEGNSPGVSNLDPSATKPTADNMWIKDGPHMMLILPDPAAYAEMSNDTSEPVYVMWKDTPFAHLMVRIAEADPS